MGASASSYMRGAFFTIELTGRRDASPHGEVGVHRRRTSQVVTAGMARKRLIEKVLEKERSPEAGPRKRLLPDLLGSLAHLPLAWVHPWFRSDLTDMRWLPINEDIELPAGAPAPLDLLDRLIEETSHRVILQACGCRTARRCEKHPHDIGCLLMGDSAIESPPSIRREVGVSEAKEHVARAVESGLVPMVGKARVDNYIFGVKDTRRLLTACFCCDCCCISQYERHFPVNKLDEMFPTVDGFHLEVDSICDGCRSRTESCADRCYVRAIEMRGGRAVITEKCRGCGRCAAYCPVGAVKVSIDDPGFLEESYSRIRAHVKHD